MNLRTIDLLEKILVGVFNISLIVGAIILIVVAIEYSSLRGDILDGEAIILNKHVYKCEQVAL